MTNPASDNKLLDFHGLTIRPHGSYKGVPVRMTLHPDTHCSLKQASLEAHCSLGELCRAIVMQWVSEHETDSQK